MTEEMFYLTTIVVCLCSFVGWLQLKESTHKYKTFLAFLFLGAIVFTQFMGWNEKSTILVALQSTVYLMPGFIFFYGGALFIGWFTAFFGSKLLDPRKKEESEDEEELAKDES